MAISATTPANTELGYGLNIITLTQDNNATDRHVLQIFNSSDEKIADLRQLPNAQGSSHYDIGRILQSQIKMTPKPPTNDLFTGDNEIFDYYFKVGSINVAGTITIDETVSGSLDKIPLLSVIPGRKELQSNGQTVWQDYDDYTPEVDIQYDGANYYYVNPMPGYQKALTDRHYDTIRYGDISDGKPDADNNFDPNDDELIYRFRGSTGDYTNTLQFLNRYREGSNSFGNGITYVRMATYTDTTEVANVYINNTTGNGGGPDAAVGADGIPSGSYGVIGVDFGSNTSNITDALTHAYVWVSYNSSSAYTANDDLRASRCYRIDFDDTECNDYDTMNVRWLNSLGGIDYFAFRKKREKSINVKRNTYTTTNASWDTQTFRQYNYDRGETVFNQTVDETHTANTRYLSDAESTYLENLYRSPDVQVDLNNDGEWKPVILTSNKYTERSYRKDKLFQHSITFRMANKPVAQGG